MCQIAPSYRLDFLYDENDELFGFIKDGSSKYSYVRDFLQNITGIIDSSGKFVVKYNCSAYGNVSVLQDTNGLASINPFLYKGYYFDKESGMFYCHTHYYVPDWCRWLCVDGFVQMVLVGLIRQVYLNKIYTAIAIITLFVALTPLAVLVFWH